jgi:hypothetical protein
MLHPLPTVSATASIIHPARAASGYRCTTPTQSVNVWKGSQTVLRGTPGALRICKIWNGRFQGPSNCHTEQVQGPSKSKSKSHCGWRSVSQSVLVSSPLWDSRPDVKSRSDRYSVIRRVASSLTRGRVCHLSHVEVFVKSVHKYSYLIQWKHIYTIHWL